jgi:hypothetical protein
VTFEEVLGSHWRAVYQFAMERMDGKGTVRNGSRYKQATAGYVCTQMHRFTAAEFRSCILEDEQAIGSTVVVPYTCVPEFKRLMSVMNVCKDAQEVKPEAGMLIVVYRECCMWGECQKVRVNQDDPDGGLEFRIRTSAICKALIEVVSRKANKSKFRWSTSQRTWWACNYYFVRKWENDYALIEPY